MDDTPEIQRVERLEDLERIVFVDDTAKITVPIKSVDILPLKNEERTRDPRFKAVIRSIRRHGYDNFDPIVVRLGRRGRWVIVDGGHRLTAARIVAREFFTNLFHKKVQDIYFLLFRTPLSNTRIDEPDDTAPEPSGSLGGS